MHLNGQAAVTMKSQNLSIMMTDIQGYSSASASSSREEILSLINRHNQLMQPVISFYGGKVVKTIGDAFLVVFASATDAVVCAIIIQLILREYNSKQKNDAHKLNLRVVINTGDVSLENNDIYGDAVNITARMEGLECFPGNTIGISEATYLLMNRNEIVADEVGPKEMKGIPYPVVVYLVPLDRQKLTAIPTKLLELVERSVNASSTSGHDKVKVDLTEWSMAVTSFLKEKKFGGNIGENIQVLHQNIRKNASDMQRSLRHTFSQPSVLGNKSAADLKDAPPATRFKAFAIDAAIMFLAVNLLRWGWAWFLRPVFFGMADVERDRGILELLIQVNLNYPVLLFFAYLLVFWFMMSASPGQIATRTAVIMKDGSRLDFEAAAKRSALFVISTMFLFGLPALTLFTKTKETLFDYLCKTRVVE
jgi:class 3 adenylate cyclase/uncharacterized RDD family membrane protein YckC